MAKKISTIIMTIIWVILNVIFISVTVYLGNDSACFDSFLDLISNGSWFFFFILPIVASILIFIIVWYITYKAFWAEGKNQNTLLRVSVILGDFVLLTFLAGLYLLGLLLFSLSSLC